jgi:molecular chaperone HscC
MSPIEIRQRLAALADLKVHPRDAQPNVAMIARAERIYEEHLGQTRLVVQDWLARFLAVIETQDLALIARHREELGAALDDLESRVR